MKPFEYQKDSMTVLRCLSKEALSWTDLTKIANLHQEELDRALEFLLRHNVIEKTNNKYNIKIKGPGLNVESWLDADLKKLQSTRDDLVYANFARLYNILPKEMKNIEGEIKNELKKIHKHTGKILELVFNQRKIQLKDYYNNQLEGISDNRLRSFLRKYRTRIIKNLSSTGTLYMKELVKKEENQYKSIYEFGNAKYHLENLLRLNTFNIADKEILNSFYQKLASEWNRLGGNPYYNLFVVS